MKAVIQPLAWGVAMASILAVASGLALDLTVGTIHAAEHAHEHSEHAHASPSITGKKWPTDAPLREGMTRIQEAVQQALPTDPDVPLEAAQAEQLQRDIDSTVAYLVANCELPEQADAVLHGLLSDLLKGAEALSDAGQREHGLERIIATLYRYPQVFDAPHWRYQTR